ncbi:hypothetical protein ALC57_04345 [Trachymyrmex cornetzi]|uniref:Uncharacterized protein n=1 Tax=Trachymyrmex cornetzi TaxID=471704 RepID=A0A151JCG6_9HYME|nr:hypothetical protein ALC57_04345 [Trachymyrmex cornetzi]
METITSTESFDQTKIQLLPFIIAPPSNYNTVYTSLMMVVEKSKELQNQTTFVTFDQPLYMTAVDIVLSAEPDSELSNVIIRLGGFHLVMSFLGCIGFIMKGSGLKELLSTIYAPNSVDKMLTGHAYARAIRGHLLVQLSLAKCVLDDINFNDEECNVIADIFSNFEDHPPVRKTVEEIYLLHNITKKFKQQLEKVKENSPTAKLWVQYFNMVSLLKKFIEAERTGDWEKHLYIIKLMILYFHASGHFPYAKSCQIYLQSVAK